MLLREREKVLEWLRKEGWDRKGRDEEKKMKKKIIIQESNTQADLCGLRNVRLHSKMHNIMFILNKSNRERESSEKCESAEPALSRTKKKVHDNQCHTQNCCCFLVANSILSKFLILWQHNLCGSIVVVCIKTPPVTIAFFYTFAITLTREWNRVEWKKNSSNQRAENEMPECWDSLTKSLVQCNFENLQSQVTHTPTPPPPFRSGGRSEGHLFEWLALLVFSHT